MEGRSGALRASLLLVAALVGASEPPTCYQTSNGAEFNKVLIDPGAFCFGETVATPATADSHCDCAAAAEAAGMNSFIMLDGDCGLYPLMATHWENGTIEVFTTDTSLENSISDVELRAIPGYESLSSSWGNISFELRDLCGKVDHIDIVLRDDVNDREYTMYTINQDDPSSMDGKIRLPNPFVCRPDAIIFVPLDEENVALARERWDNPRNHTSYGNSSNSVSMLPFAGELPITNISCFFVTDIVTDADQAKVACSETGGGQPFNYGFHNMHILSDIILTTDVWVGLKKSENGSDYFYWDNENATEPVPFDSAFWSNPAEVPYSGCAYFKGNGDSPPELTAGNCSEEHYVACVYDFWADLNFIVWIKSLVS